MNSGSGPAPGQCRSAGAAPPENSWGKGRHRSAANRPCRAVPRTVAGDRAGSMCLLHQSARRWRHPLAFGIQRALRVWKRTGPGCATGRLRRRIGPVNVSPKRRTVPEVAGISPTSIRRCGLAGAGFTDQAERLAASNVEAQRRTARSSRAGWPARRFSEKSLERSRTGRLVPRGRHRRIPAGLSWSAAPTAIGAALSRRPPVAGSGSDVFRRISAAPAAAHGRPAALPGSGAESASR